MSNNTVTSGQSADGNGAAQQVAANAVGGGKVILRVEGAGACYLGGSNVSSSSGFKMLATDPPLCLDFHEVRNLWFNAPAGTRVNYAILGP